MKKIKFNTYNDGIFEFGEYNESYNSEGNATEEKEFIIKGKLFFSYQSIREQDKLKFDNTGEKITMKIKVPYMTSITSSHIIKLNGELFSVIYIEPDIKKQNLYIYLTDLENDLDKHIEILKEFRKSALENKILDRFKVVWAKVEDIREGSAVKDISQRIKHKKIVTIRYLNELDVNLNKKATVDFKLKYKKIIYNIDQIINVNDSNELLEITIERVY